MKWNGMELRTYLALESSLTVMFSFAGVGSFFAIPSETKAVMASVVILILAEFLC